MLVSSLSQLGTIPARIQDSFSIKYSQNLPTIAEVINKIALPAITFFALASIPVVRADAFTECIDQCEATTSPGLARMLCYLVCAIFARG